MRQLVPTPVSEVSPADAYRDLPEAPGRPGVRLNMIASVDGATAVDGRSGPLGGPPDRIVYRLLRSFADVVLVAAGTVRAENYKPALLYAEHVEARRARGQADVPRIAVVSRRLDLDWDAPLFRDAAEPTIIVTGEDAPADALARARRAGHVIASGTNGVNLGAAVVALGALGARHVLAEGGPSLNGALADADLIDEICLTIAPILAGGDAKRILAGPDLPAPLDLELRGLLEEDGFLLCRYRVVR